MQVAGTVLPMFGAPDRITRSLVIVVGDADFALEAKFRAQLDSAAPFEMKKSSAELIRRERDAA